MNRSEVHEEHISRASVMLREMEKGDVHSIRSASSVQILRRVAEGHTLRGSGRATMRTRASEWEKIRNATNGLALSRGLKRASNLFPFVFIFVGIQLIEETYLARNLVADSSEMMRSYGDVLEKFLKNCVSPRARDQVAFQLIPRERRTADPYL